MPRPSCPVCDFCCVRHTGGWPIIGIVPVALSAEVLRTAVRTWGWNDEHHISGECEANLSWKLDESDVAGLDTFSHPSGRHNPASLADGTLGLHVGSGFLHLLGLQVADLVEGHPEDGLCRNPTESRLPACLAGNGCGSLSRCETPCRASDQERVVVGQRENRFWRFAALGGGAAYPSGRHGRLGRNAGLGPSSAFWNIRASVPVLALRGHKCGAHHAFSCAGYLFERFLGEAMEPGISST